MRAALLLLVLLGLAATCGLAAKTSAPTTVYSKADQARTQKYVLSLQQRDGSFGSALATSQATSILSLLGADIPKAKELSTATVKALGNAKDISTATPLIATLVASKSDFTLPTSTKTLLQQGLTSKSLETIYHTIRSIITLVKSKHASIADYDLSQVSKHVIALLEEDGTYRTSSDADADATAYHAGMALHILGDIFASTPEMEETARSAIRQATSKIATLVKLGGDTLDYTLGTEVSHVQAASVVARGLLTFAGAVSEAVEVTDSQINQFSQLFLSNAYSHNLSELYATLSALFAISNNNIYVPIVLSVVEATPTSFKVRVTNIVDGIATKLGVTLTSITSSNGDVIVNNVALTGEDVEFTLPNTPAWNKAEPGFYTLKFSLEPKAGFSGGERFKLSGIITRTTKIVTDITGGELSASVSESIKHSENDQVVRASHPSSLPSKLTVDASKYLHLKIQIISKLSPQHVFIQLVKHGKSAVFVGKHTGNGNYALKLNFGSAEVTESLYGSGQYSVYVLVGDSLLSQGLKWYVGSIIATIPEPSQHEDDSYFQPKPEIKHIFRTPDSRPSKFVAFIFTILVLVPLVGLLVALVGFGVRVSLPSNPSELLFAIIFQGSIGAILVLYVLYWLHLNIFQALAGAAVLGIVAIFSGNRALKALHARTAGGKSHKE